jgi:type III pantothenate kinase
MTLLCIDIGNTNIVLGTYAGHELTGNWRISTDRDRMPDEYGMLIWGLLQHGDQDPRAVDAICLASVVPPLTSWFEEMCERYFGQAPLVVSAGVKTGVRIRYDNPREVGADRIANAVATFRRYGGPACVVDFGTATTFDAISVEGDYLGGAIAPGPRTAVEALFLHTAKLPRIDLVPPAKAIGTNTVESMQSGLMWGYVGLVEGLVTRFRRELGPAMRVIATGGLASLIAAQTDVFEVVDTWLTLDGLRIIWELNHPSK